MRGKVPTLILTALLAWPGAALAVASPRLNPDLSGSGSTSPGVLLPSRVLADGPVTVGDRQSLGQLAAQNLAPVPATDSRGLAGMALNAMSGLAGLRQGASRLVLSGTVDLSPTQPSLYSRVVELADGYRVSSSLIPNPSARNQLEQLPAGAAWPSLGVPEVQLFPSTPRRSGYFAQVAGLRVSGSLVDSSSAPLPGFANPPASDTRDLSLAAELPVVPSKVDVSAHYRLVDVDRLAGILTSGSTNLPPQAVGVGGRIALGDSAQLKAGYEVTVSGGQMLGVRADAGLSLHLNPQTDVSADLTMDRNVSDGPQVRTSVGVGYRLSGDAALRASYTLINFGATSPSPEQHQASAEVSLRF